MRAIFLNRQYYLMTLLVIVVLLFVSSCSVGYYSQSIAGHTSLMLSRKPVDEVLKTADEKLQQRLTTALEIRQFAIESLGLPDNKSYTSYVTLKKKYPVWSVVAAEEFSLRAKQWCYPVIGCASYRGYYRQEAAENYANKIKAQGYEVMVGGVAAYSTLGWFADPLTSAMFKRGDATLSELIFHELAHQQLYVKNDSRFNEAFASAVGEQGAIQWLTQTQRYDLLKRYRTYLEVRDDFLHLVNQAKESLSTLYGSDKSVEEKRELKQAVFKKMQDEYRVLKLSKWNNMGWYDRWFSQPINNARLVSIATYRDLVPDFVVLFERCDKNFPRFYQRVEQIARDAKKDPANAQQKTIARHHLDAKC